MVNPDAIATTSRGPRATVEDKWRFIVEGLSRFAGRRLRVDTDVYASASETNDRNQPIAVSCAASAGSNCLGARAVNAGGVPSRGRVRAAPR
jgi:glutaminase